MSKKDEALKQALEALDGMYIEGFTMSDSPINNAITAIREALAQPAPPPECQTEAEKTAFAFGWWKALEQKRKADSALDRMADNARELGLDYEPAQQQEPVAVVSGYYGGQCVVLPTNPARIFNSGTAFYTSPQPSKPWVGLEEQDMPDGENPMYDDPRFIAGMVWANNKLREKNNG